MCHIETAWVDRTYRWASSDAAHSHPIQIRCETCLACVRARVLLLRNGGGVVWEWFGSQCGEMSQGQQCGWTSNWPIQKWHWRIELETCSRFYWGAVERHLVIKSKFCTGCHSPDRRSYRGNFRDVIPHRTNNQRKSTLLPHFTIDSQWNSTIIVTYY